MLKKKFMKFILHHQKLSEVVYDEAVKKNVSNLVEILKN